MELSATILIWAPIALLFLSAIIGIVVERLTKDACLKKFNGDFVILRMKDGDFIWGRLKVYPSCLELNYEEPLPIGNGMSKSSYVLYNKKIAEIDCIFRPAPDLNSPAREHWDEQVERLRNLGWTSRAKRAIRNFYGMLRDAFSQSVGMIIGIANKGSKTMQQLGSADKRATEVGQSLLKILPHAYEPIFETYRGSLVVIEALVDGNIRETIGRLEEYTVAYLLIRNTAVPSKELPEELSKRGYDKCDIAFPRSSSIVRHRIHEKDEG